MRRKLKRELEAERRLGEQLGVHRGRWVAVRDRAVVASDESFRELMEQVDREAVVVWWVPREAATLVL